MPVTLKSGLLKYKSASTGEYVEINAVSDNATASQVSAIQSAGASQVAAVQTQGAETLASIPQDYTTLSNDVDDLKSNTDELDVLTGAGINRFDARSFSVTNTTNWTLSNQTKTGITIVHNNTFSTGYPVAQIALNPGTYVFHADYTNSSVELLIAKDGSFYATLTDGTEFAIESGHSYEIRFWSTTQGTFAITDISIRIKTGTTSISGRVTVAEADIDAIEADMLTSDIRESSGWIDGDLQQNKAISSAGVIKDAGSDNYKIVKWSVTPGKIYRVVGSANWGNAVYAFYDGSYNVVSVGTVSDSKSDFTTVDTEVTAPSGSAYLIASYNVNSCVAMCYGPKAVRIQKWYGKKWVCVGDSLTAQSNLTSVNVTKIRYYDYIHEWTGITPINMGVSGTGYARTQESDTAFYQRIGNIDTSCDVVTIFGSFNDLGANLPIGSVDDTETTTIAGCINTTINNLYTAMPLANLGIVAPTPWDTTQPTTSGQAYNYVEMLKSICARRSIPFLDLWRESGLRPWDSAFRALAYTHDGGSGTHPDETGHLIIAPRFEAFLDTLLLH